MVTAGAARMVGAVSAVDSAGSAAEWVEALAVVVRAVAGSEKVKNENAKWRFNKMKRFGIDKIVYKCPCLNKGVIIGIYYGTNKVAKIYTSIDCESKNKCDVEKRCNWQSCPSY